jgi:hypothetical protein
LNSAKVSSGFSVKRPPQRLADLVILKFYDLP